MCQTTLLGAPRQFLDGSSICMQTLLDAPQRSATLFDVSSTDHEASDWPALLDYIIPTISYKINKCQDLEHKQLTLLGYLQKLDKGYSSLLN